jgi:hypothetical protein
VASAALDNASPLAVGVGIGARELGADGTADATAPVDAAGVGESAEPREPSNHHRPMMTTSATTAIEARRSQ